MKLNKKKIAPVTQVAPVAQTVPVVPEMKAAPEVKAAPIVQAAKVSEAPLQPQVPSVIKVQINATKQAVKPVAVSAQVQRKQTAQRVQPALPGDAARLERIAARKAAIQASR